MVIKHICKHYNTTTTDKPVFRGKIWDRVKVIDHLLKEVQLRGSIHMKFATTEQEQSDFLIYVTT